MTYDAVDLAGNDALHAIREVTVVDTTPPNITVTDPGLTKVEAGGSWAEPGAMAMDIADGSFAATIGGDTVDPNAPVGSVFIVRYDAVDIAGNRATHALREVTVVDTTPPNIVVTNPALTTVEAGGSWSEPGAMAVDIVDGSFVATIGGDTVDPNALVGAVFIVTYNAVDAAGNGATQATREVTVIDATPPVVDSVIPNPAIPDPINVAQIRYTVRFTEPVKGVDEDPAGGFDDFTVATTGLTGAFVESVTGSGGEFSLEFDVRVNTGAGDGTIALVTLSSGNVTDGASNVYTDLLLRTGPDFTIDRTSPTISIGPPSALVTTSGPVSFEVAYTGADTVSLSASDIVVNGTGTAAAAAPQILGTGPLNRTVKLGSVTGDGSLAIAIAPGTASDLAGNLARAAGPSEAVQVFNMRPTITILGENPVSLFAGQEYVDAGATATDLSGGDVTHLIEVSGTVDPSTRDQYAVTYRVTNTFGISAQVTRIVNVFPPPNPVITILGNNPTGILTGGLYTDAGATAFDEFSGDITDAIQVSNSVDPNTPDQYSVTYTVTSPLGVTVMATRIVNVVTQSVPVISITGPNPATHPVGTDYMDAGATATDGIDGDLTASIVVDNGVDPNTVGSYSVRYTVTNAAGESASVQRVVNVRTVLRPLMFVDAHADSGGDGRSESPFRTITEALNLSSTISDLIIVVRRGLYLETLLVGDGITLRSEEGAFHTLIDGGGATGDIVTLGNGSKLIGFTVGNTVGAAVRVLELAEATVSNNVLHTASAGLAAEPNAVTRFVNNTVYSSGAGVFGAPGAIFRPLKNSIFKGNETAISMDAAAIQGGSFNLFFENGANFDGPSPANTDLFEDPLFADLAQLNFHLQAMSPGRDGGDPNTAFTDIDGSINDLGADGGSQGVRDFEVPLAIITVVGETTVEAPAVVEFHASASFDEYGIDEIVWDFDQADGLSVDATGEIASQTFDAAGQFIVTLLVTDHSGLQGRARVEVNVSDDGNFPPSGGGTVSPIAGAAPLTVTFSGQGADPDGGAVTFSWELEGSVFSTEQNPMLTFPEGTPPGSKRVIVTLTDDEGAQTQRLVFVTITAETEDSSGIIDPAEESVIMINNTNSPLDATGVTVPTGAADEPIVITISPVEEVLPRFDENFGHLTQLGPAGHVFSRPVTVVIPHPADVLHNDIIEVFWYDEEGQEWRNDGIFNVTHIEGTSLHFVQFETSHFTIFNTSSIIPRTIQGIVLSEEGDAAIEGASIKLNSEGLEAFTNVDGLYSFVRNFEPGTYELLVAADGFQSETKEYDLSEAAVSKLNFEMKGVETESPRISLSPSAFNNVLREGEALAVTVSNSGAGTLDWSAAVTNGAEWLTIDISGSTITITAAENTESASRDGSIQVTDPSASNSPVTLAITQAGQDNVGCVGAGGFVSFTAVWGDVLLLLLLAMGLWAYGHSRGARPLKK